MTCRILLVEDDDDIRIAFCELLEMNGHAVVEASTGREALERLRETERLDLILLDLLMPDIDGWAIRERQRDQGLHPSIPVVIVSGVSSDLRSEAAAIGAVEALSKPVSPQRLLAAIKEHC